MKQHQSNISLQFFDQWQLHIQDEVSSIPSRKRVALLAYLALEANQMYSRTSLLGLLWPEMSEAEARNNLRVILAQLRKLFQMKQSDLPSPLTSNRHEIGFLIDPNIEIDVLQFEALVSRTEQHKHADRASCVVCQGVLQTAVSLYRGELLNGFYLDECPAFDDWLFVKREALHLQMMDILVELADFHERQGAYKTAVQYARRQIQLDPLQENAHRQLMRLLAYQGQRAMALQQYEQVETIMQAELGVMPEADTVWLFNQTNWAVFRGGNGI